MAGDVLCGCQEARAAVNIGPELMIPLTGSIGTGVGMALMFWGRITPSRVRERARSQRI